MPLNDAGLACPVLIQEWPFDRMLADTGLWRC